ncbi:MAG: dephospho-CoA kinase [Holdemanella sp.]|nr:dephospho-CoA kinase [Holdemanella sp.]
MPALSEKKVIALTGSMGSGKSMACSILKENYPVIDCDEVNRELLIKGNEGYKRLVKLEYIHLDDNGNINKAHMASIIFSNPDKKHEIESILHPLIFKEINKWVKKQDSSIVFVEVPILFESGRQNEFDEVWCVLCDEDIALQRLQKGRNIPKDKALERLRNQWDPALKRKLSDVIITNNGSIDDLRYTIKEELQKGRIRWS